MAWNNNNNNNYNGGYNNNGNNGYNNNNSNRQKKKHSGATLSRYVPTSGPNKGLQQQIVNGWMYRRNTGLTKFTAVTTSKSKLSESGWFGSVAITVISANGQKSFYYGTMEKSTGKVVINDLGIVMNPKGGRGGYCGPFGQK